MSNTTDVGHRKKTRLMIWEMKEKEELVLVSHWMFIEIPRMTLVLLVVLAVLVVIFVDGGGIWCGGGDGGGGGFDVVGGVPPPCV